jgi:predicted dehydrogenase
MALAGRDPEKSAATAKGLGVPRVFENWRALVADPAIDLVSIVTPPVEHRAMAIAALEAGKHVIAEKPTAMNAPEAEEMLDAAESRPHQVALVDHELRFLPAWRIARERVDEIAPLRFAEVRYASPSRGDRNRAWNWWSDAAQGGGVLGAIGSHIVDALRYLAGEIIGVRASLHTYVGERPYEGGLRAVTSDDYASLELRLAGGVAASVLLSVVASVDEPTTITLHGERGGIRLIDQSVLVASLNGSWKEVPSEQVAAVGNSPGGPYGSGTVWFGRALRAALVDGDSDALAPAATFRDGLAQQQVLDAARRSSTNGSDWIAIP